MSDEIVKIDALLLTQFTFEHPHIEFARAARRSNEE